MTMNKISKILLATGMTFVLTTNAQAYYFDIQSGINSGQFNIMYVADGSTDVDLKSYSLDFTANILPVSYEHTPPFPLFDFAGGITPTKTGGNISAGAFGGSATMNSDYRIATVSFGYGWNGIFDWNKDSFDMGWKVGTNSFSTNSVVAAKNAIINYAAPSTYLKNSSAVPIPAAAWLLGSGLLGLMGIRRKRS